MESEGPEMGSEHVMLGISNTKHAETRDKQMSCNRPKSVCSNERIEEAKLILEKEKS